MANVPYILLDTRRPVTAEGDTVGDLIAARTKTLGALWLEILRFRQIWAIFVQAGLSGECEFEGALCASDIDGSQSAADDDDFSCASSQNTPLSPTAPCNKESGGKFRGSRAAFSNLPQTILPAPKPQVPNPSFPLLGCVSRQLHSASKLPLHRTCTLLPPFLLLLPHACLDVRDH